MNQKARSGLTSTETTAPSAGRLDRRGFLLSVGLSALPARAQQDVARPTVRAAVLGTGHAHAAGKTSMLRSLPQFELVGVCEPDPVLLRRLSGPAYDGVPRISLEQTLDDPAIEMIAVESRVEESLEHAELAVRAGKHVHLDKPPGADLQRFEKLLHEASRRGGTVQMGYMWRYNAGIRLALEIARSGFLGQVYGLRGEISSDIPSESRRQLARFRGGMMFELGCHLIDRMVDLLGDPLQTSSFLRHDGTFEDELADNTLAVFEYPDSMAEIRSSAMQPSGGRHRRLEIQGNLGTVTVSPLEPPAAELDLKQAAGPYQPGLQRLFVSSPPRYEQDFVELAEVVRGRRKPSFSPEHDLRVQKVLLDACRML